MTKLVYVVLVQKYRGPRVALLGIFINKKDAIGAIEYAHGTKGIMKEDDNDFDVPLKINDRWLGTYFTSLEHYSIHTLSGSLNDLVLVKEAKTGFIKCFLVPDRQSAIKLILDEKERHNAAKWQINYKLQNYGRYYCPKEDEHIYIF